MFVFLNFEDNLFSRQIIKRSLNIRCWNQWLNTRKECWWTWNKKLHDMAKWTRQSDKLNMEKRVFFKIRGEWLNEGWMWVNWFNERDGVVYGRTGVGNYHYLSRPTSSAFEHGCLVVSSNVSLLFFSGKSPSLWLSPLHRSPTPSHAVKNRHMDNSRMAPSST